MSDDVSLYELSAEAADALPLQPGDLQPVQLLQTGRIELPSGMRVRVGEDMDLFKETTRLDKRRHAQLLQQKWTEKQHAGKRPRKQPRITKTARARALPNWKDAAGKPGELIGKLSWTGIKNQKQLPMYSAGPIRLGTDLFTVVVIPGRRLIWLCRHGVILLLSRAEKQNGGNPWLKYPPTDPSVMTPEEKSIWGDAVCRQVLDLYTSSKIVAHYANMRARYHKAIKVYMEGAVVDCAAAGLEREVKDFILACDRTWTTKDVTQVDPTIKHAIFVTLALDLSEDRAVQLIEYAALMDLGLPIFQREVALALYHEARRQMSKLCPQWVIRGVYTDWSALGTSIGELMKLEFFRTVNDAEDRGIALDASIGLRLAATQLGTTPLAGSYVNRKFNPEIGLECVEKLKNLKEEDVNVASVGGGE